MKILLIIFIILLIIIIALILGIKKSITKFCENNFGMNIKGIIEETKEIEDEIPKSISSLESLTLPIINKDFPDLNINELKAMAESKIIDCLTAIENKKLLKSELISDKVTNWINSKIEDYKSENIKFENIKFHKTALNKYEKSKGIATIRFQTALEYYLIKNGNRKKVQDRFQTEFIYVIDASKVDKKDRLLGMNCPNCGAPIKSLEVKNCYYCGTGVLDLVRKSWLLSNINQY